MAIVAEKLHAGSVGRPAENFALLDKIRIFCVSLINSLPVHQNPVGDAPKFGTVFSAFIADERCIIVCRHAEPFRSFALPIDGGSSDVRRNLVFPAKIFRGGVRKIAGRFPGLTLHQTCVQISLKDG